MASSHILQIFLRVTVQNQIGIAQRVVIDEIVQFCLLRHGHIQHILGPGAVNEDYSDGGIDSLSKRDVYEIIDASGNSPKKANKKEASNEKSVKQKTSSFLGDYDRALMENFRLKKELFNAEEESKYRSKNDSYYLPLEKLKKTERYENQLNKIKESENKLSKIKAEKPEELDKDAIKSELKIMNDGQDWFENRVKSFREKGYDKSDDEK